MCARDCFRLDIFRIMSIIIAECLSYMAARRGTPPRVWFFRVAFLIFYKRRFQIWRITTMFSCLADMSFIPALSWVPEIQFPPDPCGSRICRCRDRHARPAPCQYQTRREYSGLYPEERNAAAEHIRRKKCRGSNPYRPPRPENGWH